MEEVCFFFLMLEESEVVAGPSSCGPRMLMLIGMAEWRGRESWRTEQIGGDGQQGDSARTSSSTRAMEVTAPQCAGSEMGRDGDSDSDGLKAKDRRVLY